jgi:hypothetical protein
VTAPILQHDEHQARQRVAFCASLATRESELRAEVHEAERRLMIVGEMRTLYADLRAAKQRIASELEAHHEAMLSE